MSLRDQARRVGPDAAKPENSGDAPRSARNAGGLRRAMPGLFDPFREWREALARERRPQLTLTSLTGRELAGWIRAGIVSAVLRLIVAGLFLYWAWGMWTLPIRDSSPNPDGTLRSRMVAGGIMAAVALVILWRASIGPRR